MYPGKVLPSPALLQRHDVSAAPAEHYLLPDSWLLQAPLVCAVAGEHHGEGTGQDPEIHPDAPVGHIIAVQADPFLVGRIVSSGDLPQARDARAHPAVIRVDFAVFGDLGLHDGTRPHQAHLAPHHIDQLGQFIQAALAQEAAHAGDTGVMLQFAVLFPLVAQVGIFLQTAGLRILDWDQLPPAQACWLEGRPLPLWDPCGAVTNGEGGGFLRQEHLPEQDGPAVCVHWQRLPARQGRLRVALPSLVLGLGCRKGIPAPLVATAVEGLLLRHGLEPQALAALATGTEKAREPALQELARRLGLPLLTFDAAELAAVSTPHPSTAAGERFACAPFSVCEAACLLAARRMAATGMMKVDGGGASPVSRSALKDGPPAGTENGQQTDGTDVPAARLLVEKTKVAGQLTLAVALSNSILRRDDV